MKPPGGPVAGNLASPTLGRLPVAAMDADLVVKVLQPIWEKKPETASRVRGRIEAVLDWATAKKLRQGDNPARWQGNLEHLLSERPRAISHLAALPYAEIGARSWPSCGGGTALRRAPLSSRS